MTVRVGLTGGMASGKSTVSAILAELGAVVIDADALAREVVARGTPGLAAVVAEFGPGLLTPEGDLDRPAMGALVFGDAGARKRLEAIIHPLVIERMARARGGRRRGRVVVHDIPLLAEGGRADTFDAVVVVDAPADLQVERMVGPRAGPARTRSRGSPRRPPVSSGSRSRRTSSTTPARSTSCGPGRQVEAVFAELARGLPSRGSVRVTSAACSRSDPRLALIAAASSSSAAVPRSGTEAPDDAARTTSPSASPSTPRPADAETTETRTPRSAWGPTVGRARGGPRRWSPTGRPSSSPGRSSSAATTAPTPPSRAAMVRDHHLAGMSVTNGNIVDEAQVRAMTAALAPGRAGRRPRLPGRDRRRPGGRLRLAPARHRHRVPGLRRGRRRDRRPTARRGARSSREAAYATGLELRDLGFTWVFAPGRRRHHRRRRPDDRHPLASEDPAVAAKATARRCKGYDAAGIVSTVKHFPGPRRPRPATATTPCRCSTRRSGDPGPRPAALRGRDRAATRRP